jgi:hypothetical protein
MATASITRPAAGPGVPLPGAPPFFAGIVAQPSSVPGQFVDAVKIFSSGKGTPAGTIAAPNSQDFFAVSKLGDDHTFVAARFSQGPVSPTCRRSPLTRRAGPAR